MPKDLKEEVKTPKKKMVVVEEVVESPEVIEAPKTNETSKTEEVITPVEVIEEEVEKTNYLWIIIPTALLIGALVGGLITYFSGISKLDSENIISTPVVSATPEVKATATPTPKSEIDRSLIKLQVLNGSGVSGLAGKAKTYLEELGYKNVVVGNATVSNLTETTISVKDSKKELLKDVIADLSVKYKVAEKTEILSSSSKYDIVITLGSK
ncbi:MAG: hypothetical protein ACD_19C00427G0013 [uncultured bacterium]|nr:MAG: hypothetical protein ACD_19C00427G0013 [uncultured bacterium]